MATVAITTVLSVLDGTISNVALPTIAQDLSVSSAAVVWVVNAFQLTTTMLIVPLTTYGDIGGFARLYRAGVVIFIVGSILCASAHTLSLLVAGRCVQAIGAAGILATSQPITRFAFPRTMLGMAIGVQSLIVSISSAAGPALGGLILGIGSWPWLFWINVPFALVALALSGMLPDMPRASHRFDWLSAVLSGATLALFITGLDQLRAPAHVLVFALEIVAALILGTTVVRRQSQLETPFIPLDLLKIRIVRLSAMTSITAFMSQNAGLIALPFYFHALGYAATQTGLLMTPFPVGSALMALFAGRLSDRYHAGILGAVGLLVFAASMVLLAILPDHPATFDVVWRTALGGAGFAIFVAPNLRAMVSQAPPHRSGAVTGLTTTARMTGQTIGVALTALIFSAGGGTGSHDVRVVLWVSVGLALVALGISSLRIESVREMRREGRAGPWT
ncbi:MAG TPA: MFS transporter [Candidatus Lustribacter sp.]|nr:MFS transporter [Candidatus Lustribacter sp.]